MERHAAARTDEVHPDRPKVVCLGGINVGLFLLPDGTWRAYRDQCPHMGAPLCRGPLQTDSPTPSLTCPLHLWEFDLSTGAWVENPAVRLTAYRVEEERGTLYVWV